MNNPIVVPMTVASARTSIPVGVEASANAVRVGLSSAIITPAVTGVKGNAEATYRTGDVNLTPSDLGIDLTGYVVDPSYVHTDNNFTDALKTKLDGLDTVHITIDDDSYEVTYFVKGEWNGIPGVGLCYDDGSLDGGFVFLADDDTLTAFASFISDNYATIASVPTKTSDLNNDSGFITSASVPTKTSDLQNDSGYINGAQVPSNETDPTVPSWAKAASKPTYTASEVGALPDTTAIPSKTSDLQNDSGFITSSAIPTNVSAFNNDAGYLTSAHEVPSGGNAGQVLKKISATDYDIGWRNESETLPSAYCTTSGSTSAKKASCSLWAASSNSYLHFLLGSANTSASALTLEINVTGAKPVYINGEASSATNYSLPAGSYIVFYDGTNYHFRTDGKLPADITGISGKTVSIPMGWLDDTSTATVMTAQVDGITELRNGVCCYLTNGVITSASGWTLNINGLGAKPVYQSQAAASRTTTLFNVAYTGLFVYNESRVSGGCWDYFYGYNSDTNTIAYNIRNYQSGQVMASALTRYKFCFTRRSDGKLIPCTATSNSTGTTKTLTTEAFDPFRDIFYYATTTGVAADASPLASYMYIKYGTCDLRYGFNAGSTLTAKAPVYIRCTPNADKTVTLDGNDCVTQTLPATIDGKVYLYLGRAYSTYQIELDDKHPLYQYTADGLTTWS